jgi:iron complex outermembrane recepter protein
MNRICALAGVAIMSLLSTGGLFAQEQQSGSQSQPATKPEYSDTVVVTASGEIRAEQSVDRTAMIESAPGTSPIQVISQLPSVSVTTADPYGSYEWAAHISVRGFNQNQLGFTLDEVPLGDMSYGNWNGLHISRAIMDENIGNVVLSQGTGALETASTSNLGGTIQFYSLDPSDTRGISLDQSFGSFNASRTVLRLESGLLKKSTKFYLTGVYQRNDKWRGAGDIGQNYWQINSKAVHYIGSKGVLSGFLNYSNRQEVDYQDVNKIWVEKLGYNWDNYGNWAEAIQAANACNGQGSYPFPVNTLASNEDPCDAAYYGGGGLRRDILGGVTYKAALTSHLTWKTTGYGHRNDGRGLWFTPYTPTPNGASPISMRTSEYGISRGGFLTSLTYETPRNKLEGGVWFEGEGWDLARRYYATSIASPVQSLHAFPENPFQTDWAYTFDSTVYQIHLQDAYKVSDAVTISAGFKTVETNTDGKLAPYILSNPSYKPGQYAQGSLESGKPFLPQIGASWRVDGHNELFADVAYNVRSFVPGGYGFGNSPWGTTQAIFDSNKHTLKPESSWSEEVGYRLSIPKLRMQASYFHVNFNDRLLAITQGTGIQGLASVLSNVGGVTTNGIDAAATVQLGYGISFYNAGTWNRSTYDSNVIEATSTGTKVDPTEGKIAVDAPQGLYKTQLQYHKRELFANIGADYMSKRYFTYSNDGSVDGRLLANLSGGYQREQLGALSELKLQFNIYNLAGAKYYSSVGTNGFIVSDPNSVALNTLQVGAPRTIVGTFSFKF